MFCLVFITFQDTYDMFIYTRQYCVETIYSIRIYTIFIKREKKICSKNTTGFLLLLTALPTPPIPQKASTAIMATSFIYRLVRLVFLQ